MAIHDGRKVSFVGDPSPDGLAIGDTGKVIAGQGEISHVMWDSGRRTGSVTVEADEDLVVQASPRTTAATLDDSLDDGSLVTVSVRETYDDGGDVALLNALASAGHLSTMQSYAEEAQALIASRIRTDPSFREVLAQLDPEEGDSLVGLASAVLLRDAFSDA